ncbi:MAG: transcription antitermination factor NusB [Oscillospiraceae bacterium]|nr:transcription antitermination factor NusB [Oscillospiraceae bacterium]
MTARQLAFQLLFMMESRDLTPEEAWELFFQPEHFETLAEEDVIFQELPDAEQEAYIRSVIGEVYARREELDEKIRRYSDNWRIERLSTSTLAILRLALCEVLCREDVPAAVAVDEAVQLAKRYDSPQSASFINGVLGSCLREERGEEGNEH